MLRVDGICVSYGKLQALWNVSLYVDKGEFVSIIGPNGAGKTTLLKTISGLLRPSSGYIEFLNERIEKLPPHMVCEKGIVQVPEGRKLFPFMKVIENLELGAYLPKARKHVKDSLEQVYSLFPVLKERKNQMVATLSGGEQQMLALGRALMAKPKLLMLDEPSFGLAPKLAMEIFKNLKALNERGLTILLVSQEIFLALCNAHRSYVLENGRITLEGAGKELLENRNIKKSYLAL